MDCCSHAPPYKMLAVFMAQLADETPKILVRLLGTRFHTVAACM